MKTASVVSPAKSLYEHLALCLLGSLVLRSDRILRSRSLMDGYFFTDRTRRNHAMNL